MGKTCKQKNEEVSLKKEVVVKIEFITPAFIGGADPESICEIREDSLKGTVRFWWRAFCSTKRGSYEELLNEENAIFGGQESKSKVSLFISPVNDADYLKTLDWNALANFPGIQYLLFPFRSGNRKYIKPGTQFEIRVIADNDGVLFETFKALWFFENFGGLGARSRRGLGSFRVVEIKGPLDSTKIPKFIGLQQKEEIGSLHSDGSIKEYLQNQIDKFATPHTPPPSFTAYSSKDSELKVHFFDAIRRDWEWEQPLDWIGTALKRFRAYNNSPFNKEAAELHRYKDNDNTAIIPDPLQKTAFGLPIVYNFRDELDRQKDERISIEATTSNEKEYGRRASPLFFKVGKICNSDTHYYVTALLMWSEFLPSTVRIKLKPKFGRDYNRAMINPVPLTSIPSKAVLLDFLNNNFR